MVNLLSAFVPILYRLATIVSIVSIFYYLLSTISPAFGRKKASDAPWGLPYMKYSPRWISGIIHCRHALRIMRKGAQRYPDVPFKMPRHDVDLVVLPPSVVNELASLPTNVASNILALQYDLVGGWCGLSMLNDADLHHRVVGRRITPNLDLLAPEFEQEVADCFSEYFPKKGDEWVEMNPYQIMNRVAARVFSRIVVGPEYCRNEQWLDFAMNFTENVFKSVLIMRHFPPWTYPIFHYLLPSVGKCVQNIHQVEALLGPVFQQLLDEKNLETGKASADKTGNNCLNWLSELAAGEEQNPTTLVHAQILLALGAIHTSLFAELNMLYDLMANPTCIDAIRAEVAEVSKNGWSFSSYSELHKLDSILRESQRMSPPFMIGLRRVMKVEHTFTNGVTVDPGSYVCVFTPSVQNAHLAAGEDPDEFKGLRSFHQRKKENALNSTKHLFSTTDMSVLGFGHGRTACPGRYSASLALKVIFVKLMMDYDFRHTDGQRVRPKNIMVNEIIAPDPSLMIQVKARESGMSWY